MSTPPVAYGSNEIVPEDGYLYSSVSGSDDDFDGLSFRVVTWPQHGFLSFNGDGSYTYTPDPNFWGDDSFEIVANDGSQDSAPATVNITVGAKNDEPYVVDPNYMLASGQEDTPYVVTPETLLFNYGDIDGDTLTITSLTADHGSVTQNPDGSWTIEPDTNYSGTMTLSFMVEDGATAISGTTSYTVNAVADVPVRGYTPSLPDFGNSTTYLLNLSDLIGGFTDGDDDPLSVINLTADNATVISNGDGTWTVTPDSGFSGTLTYSYQVTDGGNVVVTSMQQTVTSDNAAPELTGAQATLVAGTEDTDYVVSLADLLEGITDGDADELSISTISADHGTVTDNGDDTFTVTPTANYNGTVTLTYTVSDGNGGELADQTLSFMLAAAPEPAIYSGGTETRVNTFTSNDQTVPNIAALSGGGYVITWQSGGQDGSENGIYAQRYDANGDPAGDEFRVNTYVNSFQENPVVTALSDGGYVITWMSNQQDGSGHGIYAQRYDSDGVAVGDETRINTYTSGAQAFPAISALSDGGYVIAWVDYAKDGSGTGVYAQRYDATGDEAGIETRVNTTTSGAQEAVSTASLSGGGYVITWQSAGQDGSGTGIYAQRYDSAGEAEGSETPVNTTTSGGQSVPAIGALSGGGYVIVWQSDGQDGAGLGIYSQRYNASGSPLGSETRANTYTSGQQSEAAITPLSDGGYVITWQSEGQDGAGYGIYAQRYDASGAVVGGEFLVNSATSGSQSKPAVAVLANGDIVFTWQGPDASGNGIFQRTFERSNEIPTGSPTGSVDDGTEDTDQFIDATDLLSGFDDEDGDTLTISAISADHGALTATTGGWTFTPEPDYNGTVTLTYTVSDGRGGTIPNQTRTFSLQAVNDAPTGSPAATFDDGTENTDQIIDLADLLAGFDDADGDVLSVSAISADHGTLTDNGDDTYTFSPEADYTGEVVITYTVSDGNGGELAGQTRTFTLEPPNSVPTGAAPVLTSGTEDVTYTVTGAQLRAGFTDADGDTLTIQNLTANYSQGYVGGTATSFQQNSGATVFYQTALEGGGFVEICRAHNGSYFTFARVFDASGTQTAQFNVSNPGGVIALSDGSFVLTQTIWTGTNDLAATHYSAAGTVLHSQVNLAASTTAHEQGFDGLGLADGGYLLTWTEFGTTNIVKYQAFNADGTARGSAMSVTASANNQQNAKIDQLQDGSFVITWVENFDVYAQRFEADGDSIGAAFRVNTTTSSYQYGADVAALEGGGFVAMWSDLTTGTRAFQVYDASGSAVGGEKHITGSGVFWQNNTSWNSYEQYGNVVALPDGGFAIASMATSNSIGLWRFDAAGNMLGSQTVVQTESNGTISNIKAMVLEDGSLQVTWMDDYNGGHVWNRNFVNDAGGSATVTYNSATDTYSITRPADTNGLLTIDFEVNDGNGGVKAGSTTLNINAVNDAPRGSSSTVLDAINEDGSIVVTRAQLLAGYSDVEGQTLAIRNNTVTSSSGTVSYNSGAGTWTITPAANYNGTVTLSYTVWDGSANATNAGSLTFTVNAVNDAPVGNPNGTVAGGTEDTSQTILNTTLLSGLSDVEGGTLSVTAISADHGTLTATTGGWTFTPEANYNGTVTLTYTVSDGQGGERTGLTRTFTLASVNDVPTGTPNGTIDDGTEDTAQFIDAADLLSGFSDSDGGTLTVSAISADHGTLTATSGGWTFTPQANYTGTVTLTYTVSDGQGGTITGQTRTFDLTAENDAPSGTPPVLSAGTEDVTYTVTGAQLRAGFTDAEGDTFAVTGLTAEYSQGFVGGTANTYGNRYFNTQDSIALADGGSAFMFRGYNNGYIYYLIVNNADGTTANTVYLNTDANLVALDDGSFVALSVRNQSNYTVTTATRYSAAGTVIGSPVDIVTTSSSYKLHATGVALSDGGYLLTWAEIPIAGGANLAYARAFNADGSASGDLITIGSSSAGATNLYLSAHEDGSFIVVWQEFGNPTNGNRYDIYSQRFAADGTALGSAARVNTTASGEQQGASVSVLDGGGHVITWRDGSTTKFMVYDANGAAIGGEHTITGSNNAITQYYQTTMRPEVVGLEDGGFVITTGYTDTSGHGVAIVRFDALANQLGSVVSVPTDESGDQVNAQISLRGDGSLLVVWDSGGVVNTRVFAEGTAGNATVTYDAETDTYSITRPADFNGLLKINYTLDDGNGGTVPVSTTLNINAVNDAPTGSSTTGLDSINEDGSIVVTRAQLLAGYSDVDNATLAIRNNTVTSSSGTVSYNSGAGTWTITPAANYNGTVTLSYTVWDGALNAATGGSLTFTVNAVNDAPIGNPNGTVSSGMEDTSQTILATTLLSGLSDVEGGTLSVTAISADHGTLTETDGGWTFEPDANYNGSVTLTYTVSDGQGGERTGLTRTFSLTSVNDLPTGTPDGTIDDGTEDTAQFIAAADLLSGFSDSDGGTLSVSAISADHGTLTATTGGWTYTPAANHNGTVTITYTVSDGQGGTITGQTRSFTLDAANDAPALTGEAAAVSGDEDASITLTLAQLTQGYTDAEGDTISVTNVTVNHGTLTDNTDGTWTLEPEPNYNGTVVVSYTLDDGNGETLDTTLGISVAAVNDAPTGSPTTVLTAFDEDGSITVTLAELLAGFSDVDVGTTLAIQNNTVVCANSTVTYDGLAQSWTITPNADYNGTLRLLYKVTDGVATLNTMLTVAVNAVNDAPTGDVTLPDGVEDTVYTLTTAQLLDGITDAEGDTLVLTSATVKLAGTDTSLPITFGPGTYSVTPPANYDGGLDITYTLSDLNGGTITITKTIDIASVNDVPTGSPTGTIDNGTEDTPQTIAVADLLQGFSDIDGTLTVSAISADHGTISDNGDGTYTFTPDTNYNGDVVITYTVSDGAGGLIEDQTLTFSLDAVNDGAPESSQDPVLGNGVEDTGYTVAIADLLAGFSDPDGVGLTVINLSSDRGTIVNNNDGTLTITPDADYYGPIELSYDVTDGEDDTPVRLTFALTQVIDTRLSSVSATLAPLVENLTLTGAAHISGTGNAQDNVLVGNTGNNMLWGLGGNDTLSGNAGIDIAFGGSGDDTYWVNRSTDVASEETVTGIDDGGYDKVYASASFTLGAFIEELVLRDNGSIDGTGNAGANTIIGNTGDNVLSGLGGADVLDGRSGNDTLDGGEGADQMFGGAGNDRYYVDNAGDVVSEYLNGKDAGGVDEVFSSLTYTLGSFIENLTLTGSGDLRGTGNALNNLITGNAGNNALLGEAGQDTLYGLGGNDTLKGGAGADIMFGGAGDDIYYVDHDDDAVSEQTVSGIDDGGVDKVITTVSYTLGEGVENLSINAGGSIDGTGNAGANTIIGNTGDNVLSGLGGADVLDGRSGNDTLDGGEGADQMFGGAGNDRYYVDNAGDVVSEYLNGKDAGGVDEVFSSLTYTLGSFIENLTLTGSGDLRGTGNALNNLITGNAGNNALLGEAGQDTLYGLGGNDTLKGGAGADIMFGGAGDDIYYVDHAGDVVSEQTVSGTDDGGVDKVITSVSFTLGEGIEILSITSGASVYGTGNALGNTIAGYTGDNVLSGLGGNDSLNGRSGNDTLIGGEGADTLIGGTGTDSFVFESAPLNGLDIITDFVSGVDELVFSSVDYGFDVGHSLTASEFSIGTSATGGNAQFFFDAATHTLYFDADGAGGDEAVALATFSNNATPAIDDFTFV